jgi:hypothetical protein
VGGRKERERERKGKTEKAKRKGREKARDKKERKVEEGKGRGRETERREKWGQKGKSKRWEGMRTRDRKGEQRSCCMQAREGGGGVGSLDWRIFGGLVVPVRAAILPKKAWSGRRGTNVLRTETVPMMIQIGVPNQ